MLASIPAGSLKFSRAHPPIAGSARVGRVFLLDLTQLPLIPSACTLCAPSRNELPTAAIPLPSLLATGFGRTVSFLNPGLGQSEMGIEKLLYGLAEKTTKSKNLQAQTPQADERKPPQEAFALQVVKFQRIHPGGDAASAPPFSATLALPGVRSGQASRRGQVSACCRCPSQAHSR